MELEEALRALPPGPCGSPGEVLARLATAWPYIHGGAAADMSPDKLLGRVVGPRWVPPVLTFDVRRAGVAADGSPTSLLQTWQVDIQDGVAWVPRNGPLELPPKEDAAELGRMLVADVVSGKGCLAVVPKPGGGLAIRPGEVAGLDVGYAETLAGRHHRFRAALDLAMAAAGFVKIGPYRFARGGGSEGKQA